MMLFPATIVFLFCVFPEITKADDPPERVVLRIGRTYTPVYNATKEHLATLRRGLAWLMPEGRRSILFITSSPVIPNIFKRKRRRIATDRMTRSAQWKACGYVLAGTR